MLDLIIRWALTHRLLTLALAVAVLAGGASAVRDLPLDVLPDLDRPRVTVFLEAPGMAPEEVEALVTRPIETALNGATGVEAVRSSSTVGLGMIFVEFAYGTDLFRARQVVAEKLQSTQGQLPEGIAPVLGPVSSIMGQIMLVGMSAGHAARDSTGKLLPETSPATLRGLADYTVRQRLLSIPGVAQVIPIGGDTRQFQVLADVPRLRAVGLSVGQLTEALRASNRNTTGNFFERNGSEVLIRNIGRLRTVADIEAVVVGYRAGAPVTVGQVARVQLGARYKRGDAGVSGHPAVILSIEKQPSVSTTALTQAVEAALTDLAPSLPPDVRFNPTLFRQADFIEHALRNVEDALRDGAILVVIVLFLFLLNWRTTLISLTAIPLSLLVTALVFRALGLSINTLTLGGLAIAVGELVDDAIVDVENVYRRLRENSALPVPRPTLQVVYEASAEVRNAIVYATLIVVLVFLPLFALTGMEGRIFAPLGVAYITSILASMVVSLTLTPVLCSLLLRFRPLAAKKPADPDTRLVRWLKHHDRRLLGFGFRHPRLVLGITGAMLIGAGAMLPFFGSEFLPAFNEGSLTVNFSAPAGTSLAQSNRLGTLGERLILAIPEVAATARRTGRAELDEHAESVNNSEIDVTFKTDEALAATGQPRRSKAAILADLRERLAVLRGVSVNVGQPISHRLDHLISGVRAQVAVKVFGPDLMTLRRLGRQVQAVATKVPGVVDFQTERQVQVPQLLIRPRPAALRAYGMERGPVVDDLETLLQGTVVGRILAPDGQQSFELVVKLPDSLRSSVSAIGAAPLQTPDGGLVPVSALADLLDEPGPNTINHENAQRRLTLSFNVAGRDLGSTVGELQARLRREVRLPSGYYLTTGGQFERREQAGRQLTGLGLLAVAGIFLILFAHFRSVLIVAQVMLSLPLALIGAVAAVALTGGTLSLASLVGFITLTGIAARNGIMMISHYLHLVEAEGETFSDEMIVRGSLERLVPVLMTALVAALALLPLTLDPTAAGKEILYPVATVILGGLLSSTLLDVVVTPVVFRLFGRRALAQWRAARRAPSVLVR